MYILHLWNLQSVLREYSKTWTTSWNGPASDGQLGFNEAKCKVIHLGTANSRHQYIMNNTPLEATREEKDLGDRWGVKVSSTRVTGSEEGISNARFSPCHFHLPGRDNNSKAVHHHGPTSSRVRERNLAPTVQTWQARGGKDTAQSDKIYPQLKTSKLWRTTESLKITITRAPQEKRGYAPGIQDGKWHG